MITPNQRDEIRQQLTTLEEHAGIAFGILFPRSNYDKKKKAYVQVTIFTPGEDLNFFNYQETMDFLRGAIFMESSREFLDLVRKTPSP